MPETPIKQEPILGIKPSAPAVAQAIKQQPKVVPIVKPAPPKQVTIKELLDKVTEIKTWYLGFSGKKGFNPHFYILNHIEPVLQTLKKSNGVVTQQIIAAVNALAKKEPTI
jgi:hypothetical protein